MTTFAILRRAVQTIVPYYNDIQALRDMRNNLQVFEIEFLDDYAYWHLEQAKQTSIQNRKALYTELFGEDVALRIVNAAWRLRAVDQVTSDEQESATDADHS